jgi:hypothetical protein
MKKFMSLLVVALVLACSMCCVETVSAQGTQSAANTALGQADTAQGILESSLHGANLSCTQGQQKRDLLQWRVDHDTMPPDVRIAANLLLAAGDNFAGDAVADHQYGFNDLYVGNSWLSNAESSYKTAEGYVEEGYPEYAMWGVCATEADNARGFYVSGNVSAHDAWALYEDAEQIYLDGLTLTAPYH